MKDNKKKEFTGKELGIIVLNNIKRVLENQEPVYSKEEITTLESSLNGKRDIDKFKEYKIIAGNVEDLFYITNRNVLEAQKSILRLTDIIKEEFTKLRLSYYEQLFPILVTSKQYNDAKSKENFKDVKFSVDTISDIGLPVYSEKVEYKPENIPELAIVINPSRNNIDSLGYYKQQRADGFFDKNIAFHNKYEGVEEKCKQLIKSVEENLKRVFAYYEFVKLMSNSINVDFTSIMDMYIEDLNYYINPYNFYLKVTVELKKILPEIDTVKFKPSNTRIDKANKKVSKARSLKNVDWQEVFEVLTR